MNTKSEYLWIKTVIGSRKISNYCWALILFIGSLGFLLTGLSSYLGRDILITLPSQNITFAPQGLVMCFYGIGGLSLSFYLCSVIFWDIGSGYNEFDLKQGLISIFRWGFPGESRRIYIRCLLEDVQAIRLSVTEGPNGRRTLFMRMKDEQDIMLVQIDDQLTLREAEEEATELAKFLQIPMIS